MNLQNSLLVFSVIIICASAQLNRDLPNRIFDYDLYNKVINNIECAKQVSYMKESNTPLLGRFLDAGVRFPRGIFMLNIRDLGNYHQCLAIDDVIDDMQFQGKYCFIKVPFNQSFHLPFLDQRLTNLGDRKIVRFHNNIISEVQSFAAPIDVDSLNPGNPLLYASFDLAVCMPQACSTQEWMRNVLFDLTAIGFRYEDRFCRLPNDKPWVAADYVAIGVFSALGLISLISTLYDVNHVLIQKKDPKKAKVLLRTFSVFTNTRRLLTFSSNSNSLDCLDGIRAISMMWVIVGHTFSMYNFNANLTEAIKWLTSGDAVWISTGLFTVDTFFLMAGILLVYTSVGKLTGVQLLKRLHVFYFNRLLRMFPLLAALVLLEASAFHRVADGPYWENMGRNVERCRKYWWTTLLHIQNYYNPDDVCIQHSWYIAIDIQLHIVSPIILFWVLGKSRTKAWTALISGLLAILVASSVWNFLKELPSSNMTIPRLDEQSYYMNNYYMNALCRGAPFFVGMIVGYILNIYKGRNIRLNAGFVLISWVIALGAIASAFYTSYVIMQLDWDNQIGDSLFNSYMRTVWSIGLSWVIFACVKGYGGPINWFLSLNVWKIPARISFAMYLYHYPICFLIAGMQLAPTHFTVGARIYDFLAVFALSFMVSFLVTVVIDAPFSVLIKMLMEGGQRRPRRTEENGRSKPGPKEKSVTDLERTVITTLDKSAPPMNENLNYPEKSGPPLTFLEKNGPSPQRQESNLDKIEPISPGNGHLEKNVILGNSHYPEKSDPPLSFLEKNSPALHRQESNQDKIEPISPSGSYFKKNGNLDTGLEKEKVDEPPNYETSRI